MLRERNLGSAVRIPSVMGGGGGLTNSQTDVCKWAYQMFVKEGGLAMKIVKHVSTCT